MAILGRGLSLFPKVGGSTSSWRELKQHAGACLDEYGGICKEGGRDVVLGAYPKTAGWAPCAASPKRSGGGTPSDTCTCAGAQRRCKCPTACPLHYVPWMLREELSLLTFG